MTHFSSFLSYASQVITLFPTLPFSSMRQKGSYLLPEFILSSLVLDSFLAVFVNLLLHKPFSYSFFFFFTQFLCHLPTPYTHKKLKLFSSLSLPQAVALFSSSLPSCQTKSIPLIPIQSSFFFSDHLL